MKNAPISVLLLTLITVLMWQPTSAQDFDQLLQAVDKLESNLETLVQKEADSRRNEISRLDEEISSLSRSTVMSGTDKSIDSALTALRQEVATLKGGLSGLKNEIVNNSRQETHIAELMTEVALLKTELNDLLSSRNQSPRLASTDDSGYELVEPQQEVQVNQAVTEDATISGLEISGFFDVTGTIQGSGDDKTEFGLGQLELDLARKIRSNIKVDAALLYNSEDAGFELGWATVGVNLAERENGFLSSMDLMAGQFDVPFGIDYLVYWSKSRRLVSAPMTVGLTHGAWNDFGLQFNMASPYGNLVLYAVNGFESSAEVIDEAQSIALGEEVLEEIDTSPANAFGGRLGFTPSEGLEIGTSYAIGLNRSGKDEMILAGGDVQYSLWKIQLKGEYIYHSVNRSVAGENNRGFYFQSGLNYGRLFFTGRFGSFKPYQADWINQVTFGTGYTLAEGVEVRFESLFGEISDDNQNTLQLVAGF